MLFPEDTKATKKALFEIAVRVLSDNFEPTYSAQVRPYTYVRYEVSIDGRLYTADGFSKVCWPDQWDWATGNYYATRKALRHIVKKVTRNRKADLIKMINQFEKHQTLDAPHETYVQEFIKEHNRKFPTVTPRLELEEDDEFDGTEGQDRENYTDTQDRKNYTDPEDYRVPPLPKTQE